MIMKKLILIWGMIMTGGYAVAQEYLSINGAQYKNETPLEEKQCKEIKKQISILNVQIKYLKAKDIGGEDDAIRIRQSINNVKKQMDDILSEYGYSVTALNFCECKPIPQEKDTKKTSSKVEPKQGGSSSFYNGKSTNRPTYTSGRKKLTEEEKKGNGLYDAPVQGGNIRKEGTKKKADLYNIDGKKVDEVAVDGLELEKKLIKAQVSSRDSSIKEYRKLQAKLLNKLNDDVENSKTDEEKENNQKKLNEANYSIYKMSEPVENMQQPKQQPQTVDAAAAQANTAKGTLEKMQALCKKYGIK
jgi:hypothetical protein